MIIVDDRLAREVLAGRRVPVVGRRAVATTWGFHYRLVRALSDDRVEGRLSKAASAKVRAVAAAPPPSVLRVLDPREATAHAARLAIDHRLNLLTAELVASAQVHDAGVVLSEGNVGRTWPALFASLGVPLAVV